jgi:hypothetical protein
VGRGRAEARFKIVNHVSGRAGRLLKIAAVVVLLITGLTALTGCASDRADNRFLDLLSLMPASAADTGGFALIDYDSYCRLNDIPRVVSDGRKLDRDEFLDIMVQRITDEVTDHRELTLSSVYSGWDYFMLIVPVLKQFVGYDLTDVRAEIHNLYVPYDVGPSTFTADPAGVVFGLIGSFDAAATAQAFQNQEDWPEWARSAYVTSVYEGVTVHSWGPLEEHPRTVLAPPHVDLTGRARPLAVSGDSLLLAGSVPDVQYLLDASAGRSTSLEDLPEYVLLAEGLYKLGARTVAIMADERMVVGPHAVVAPLRHFLTVGMGYGEDETGSYVALVLVHENEGLAEENVSLLEARINDPSYRDKITVASISSGGRVLLAKLYTADDALWFSMYKQQRDLLVHE